MYKEWLQYGLAKKGKSGKALAECLGVQPSAVSRMLSGERRIFASELEAISRYIEEPVPLVTNPYPKKENNLMLIAGFINKGTWFEPNQQYPIYDDIPQIPVEGLSAKQIAYILAYDCHTHLKDSYIITINPEEVNNNFRDNDIVVVERKREDLTQFNLAKISKVYGKSKIIDLDARNDSQTTIDPKECSIVGLVVGSVTRLYRRR